MYWHLIFTGALRGHVWSIADVGAYPFGAEFDTTTGRSGFAGWIQHWEEGNAWYDVACGPDGRRTAAGALAGPHHSPKSATA